VTGELSATRASGEGSAAERGGAEPVAELVDVRRIYVMGGVEVRALDGISFTFRRGEYWSIQGSSGSGKSTLLNVLGCIDRPTSGRYLVRGEDITWLSDDRLSELRSREIGFVFQSYNLIPQLDVLENILVPILYQDDPPREAPDRARMLAERLGLGGRLDHRPAQLSGGQQQRVAIARALVNDPALILADEATGNLDSKTAEEILDLFDELHAEGKTILFVTHEQDVARRAERSLILRDGRVDQVLEMRTELAAAGGEGA
jgi:putative ABC transport system ATP-binding protein